MWKQTDEALHADVAHPQSYSREFYEDEIDRLMYLAARGRIRPNVDWGDSDGLHTHVCGYDMLRPWRKGCGHVWRHGETPTAEAHTCPNCGRGLWRMKRLPDDERLTTREPA